MNMPPVALDSVPLVGSLNFCLKLPEKKQKTKNHSNHPWLRKHPKTGEKWPIVLDVFTQEQYAIGCIFIFELLKIWATLMGHSRIGS